MKFDELVEDKPTEVPQGASQSFDDLVDDEEKYGGLTGELKAAAAGAARGLTFGLSDQALTKSGLVEPETLKGLEETNPVASIGGEIAGAVAPMFAGNIGGIANLPATVAKLGTGTAAAVTKVLPAAESLAGRIAAKSAASAAGFAAEGAVYGLGQSISEDALGDSNLASEKTLANIGFSAALMGGLGGVGGALVKAADEVKGLIKFDKAPAMLKLEAERIVNETSDDAAEAGLMALDMPAEKRLSFVDALAKKKDNASEIVKAGELIGAPVLPGQTSASKFIQNLESSLSKQPTIPGVYTQQQIQKGFDAVENVTREALEGGQGLTAFDAGELIKSQIKKTVDDIYAPIKAGYAEREALGEAINLPDKARLKLHDKLVELSQKIGSRGGKPEQIVREVSEGALRQNTVRELDLYIGELKAAQRSARISGDFPASQAYGRSVEMVEEFQIREMAKQGKGLATGKIPDFGEGPWNFKNAEAMADKAIADKKILDKKYAKLKETLSDLLSEQRLGRKSKNTVGGVEEVLEGVPSEKVIDKMFDPKNGKGLLKLKKNFPEVFDTLIKQKKAQILERATKDGRVNVNQVMREVMDEKKISSKVRELMFDKPTMQKMEAAKTWVEALPKDINPSGTSQGEAFREFLGSPVSSMINNFMSFGSKKLIESLASPGEAPKLLMLMKAEQAIQKTSKQIKKGVTVIINNSKEPVTGRLIPKIETTEDYKEKTEKIAEVANNMDALQERLDGATGSMYEYAPNLASASQMTMIRGVQFLASKIPPRPNIGLFQKELEPSKTEIATFNRYYQIVENPMLALEQVKNRTVNPETVETLMSVYPSLYEEMKNQLVEQSMEFKGEIPYQTKLAMSRFMNAPIDVSQLPKWVASNQAAYLPVAQPAQMQAKPSKSGMAKLDMGDRYELNQPKEG